MSVRCTASSIHGSTAKQHRDDEEREDRLGEESAVQRRQREPRIGSPCHGTHSRVTPQHSTIVCRTSAYNPPAPSARPARPPAHAAARWNDCCRSASLLCPAVSPLSLRSSASLLPPLPAPAMTARRCLLLLLVLLLPKLEPPPPPTRPRHPCCLDCCAGGAAPAAFAKFGAVGDPRSVQAPIQFWSATGDIGGQGLWAMGISQ